MIVNQIIVIITNAREIIAVVLHHHPTMKEIDMHHRHLAQSMIDIIIQL